MYIKCTLKHRNKLLLLKNLLKSIPKIKDKQNNPPKNIRHLVNWTRDKDSKGV